MDQQLTTGEVARLLREFNPKVTEPRLRDDIRAGRIPAPVVRAGRAFWSRDLVLAAARKYGVDEDQAIKAFDHYIDVLSGQEAAQ